jgi:hypothetical protein
MDLIRSGRQPMQNNINNSTSMKTNGEIFRMISSSSSYVDYVDKGMSYSQTFYMDSISLMLLLLKILFVFKISRYVSWIFLTLERVRIILILSLCIGNFDDFNVFGGFNAVFRRLHIHSVPDIWSVRVHIPHV